MGYKYRIPTKCVAVLLMGWNLFYIVIQLYVVLDWMYYQRNQWRWGSSLRFYVRIVMCSLHYLIDLALAILLFRSTNLGWDIIKCHWRAKWWRNVEIFFVIFYNVLYILILVNEDDKFPLSYWHLLADIVYTIFYISFIVVVWLYVCELDKAIDDGQITLQEVSPSPALLPEISEMIKNMDNEFSIQNDYHTTGYGTSL